MFQRYSSTTLQMGMIYMTGLLFGSAVRGDEAELNWSDLTEVTIASSADGTDQPSLYLAPKSPIKVPVPLLVYLHSWSSDYHQDNIGWLKEAAARGWLFIQPNFRGQNDTPQACGSKLARQDILDAIEWMQSKYHVDTRRIYLAGSSGGGHMTMLMAGHHPDRFSAASAWVGIGDLAEWYRFHTKDGQPGKYADDILKSLGGPPGTSKEIDNEYRDRSPQFHIRNAVSLPLDIAAGVTDGHTGSVPIQHSLFVYNELANAQKLPLVSELEIDELWTDQKMSNPGPSDRGVDPTYEREILLRRTAGKCRVTIFDGGHEGLPHAGCEWLSRQQRETKATSK